MHLYALNHLNLNHNLFLLIILLSFSNIIKCDFGRLIIFLLNLLCLGHFLFADDFGRTIRFSVCVQQFDWLFNQQRFEQSIK